MSWAHAPSAWRMPGQGTASASCCAATPSTAPASTDGSPPSATAAPSASARQCDPRPAQHVGAGRCWCTPARLRLALNFLEVRLPLYSRSSVCSLGTLCNFALLWPRAAGRRGGVPSTAQGGSRPGHTLLVVVLVLHCLSPPLHNKQPSAWHKMTACSVLALCARPVAAFQQRQPCRSTSSGEPL